MLTVVVVSVVVLIALTIICITAYMMGAESFEFTTAVSKILSITFKMRSSGRRNKPLRNAMNSDPELSPEEKRDIKLHARKQQRTGALPRRTPRL